MHGYIQKKHCCEGKSIIVASLSALNNVCEAPQEVWKRQQGAVIEDLEEVCLLWLKWHVPQDQYEWAESYPIHGGNLASDVAFCCDQDYHHDYSFHKEEESMT